MTADRDAEHGDVPEPNRHAPDVEANSGEDDPPAPSESAPSHEGEPKEVLSVEDLLEELESVTKERDEYLKDREEYLELARQRQAEFENFRKQTMKRQADQVAQAAGDLVEKLLPVLDAFDYGIGHGHEDLAPMRSQLLSVLEREGLERIAPEGDPFDPNEAEAVAHEPADDVGQQEVVEVLRAGYRWKGRLLRAAMVKVKG